MNKEDIKIIQRDRSFYIDDLEIIEQKKAGWDLKILHNLVEDIGEDYFKHIGVLICENIKTNKLEVLKYE